uniref:Uncharacterized protein n=1 Tax=Arundo donax TaxID=35708 RepID=A0A0A9DAJ9_ARUDO
MRASYIRANNYICRPLLCRLKVARSQAFGTTTATNIQVLQRIPVLVILRER